jgi:hypothetical protein
MKQDKEIFLCPSPNNRKDGTKGILPEFLLITRKSIISKL